nr:MAG TPA: hypothetical protein [Caudoviricetes sp.]
MTNEQSWILRGVHACATQFRLTRDEKSRFDM